jgi:hypothetical protein
MYSTSELSVLAVIKLQTEQDVTAGALTKFGELMEFVDILPRISRMQQRTSRPGSSLLRLWSRKPLSDNGQRGFVPATELDSSPMVNAKPVEYVSPYPCI